MSGEKYGRKRYKETTHLQLSQGEATTGTDLAVVLDGRAADNRAQAVDGPRGDGGGLGLAGDAAAVLLAGLDTDVLLAFSFGKR